MVKGGVEGWRVVGRIEGVGCRVEVRGGMGEG